MSRERLHVQYCIPVCLSHKSTRQSFGRKPPAILGQTGYSYYVPTIFYHDQFVNNGFIAESLVPLARDPSVFSVT
jgi:hypothetical protein